MENKKTRWYKDAIFYQIYPRSFCDSNGDGIGDIKGIISKLDYLKGLGITAVWLSPCYSSPNDDNGYDISDYRNIMSDFGTLDDWKEMIAEMHSRGIKLVMDLVVNHSSDEHEWFKESRKSKDNPYRDYYIWKKGTGKDGKKPPNNWSSRFSGSAWEYDETTGEFYLHLFSKKQPDLNWENEKVRKEVADICNYWFELGVDGFRCDVITYISKDQKFQNGKFNPAIRGDEHFVLGPRYHEFINELNQNSWSKYDTMTVGEAQGITVQNARQAMAEDRNELDSVFTFEHQEADSFFTVVPKKFNLPKFKRVFSSWQALPENCWNSLYVENHDYPRVVPRYGRFAYRTYVSKMIAVMLNFMRGTPYIYQGQEIGMTQIRGFKRPMYKDIVSIRIYDTVAKVFPPALKIVEWALKKRARDHARTPMQWNDGENAGFTTGEPWMIVNPNFKEINVAEQLDNPDSVLNFYKRINNFRLGNEIIRDGAYREFYPANKHLFVYERTLGDKGYLVVCSFSDKEIDFVVPQKWKKVNTKLVMGNYKTAPAKLFSVTLNPYECFVYEKIVDEDQD